MEYLSYEVLGKGVKPTKKGIEVVEKFPIPKNTRDVRSFLGLCFYFRKFIEHFALIAKPLYDLTKASATFQFGEAEYKAFKTLKTKLIEAPILAVYNPNSQTELYCDASSAERFLYKSNPTEKCIRYFITHVKQRKRKLSYIVSNSKPLR